MKVQQLDDRQSVQYESGLGLSESLALPVEIRPPIVQPEIEKITPQTGLKKVVIDLETSSRGISVLFLPKKSEKEELKNQGQLPFINFKCYNCVIHVNNYNPSGDVNVMYILLNNKTFLARAKYQNNVRFMFAILEELLTIHCQYETIHLYKYLYIFFDYWV